jgi:hypothetical protein
MSGNGDTDRRTVLKGAALGAAMMAPGAALAQTGDTSAIKKAVTAAHATNIKRLQDWIALPSIAAEGRNIEEAATI